MGGAADVARSYVSDKVLAEKLINADKLCDK